MGRLKKKPADTTLLSSRELMDKVVELFGSKYDDRDSDFFEHASLRDVAADCKITMLKVRKILITADMYSTAVSREVQKLYAEGKSIPEIMKRTGLSRASVHSYIPYKKVIYNLPERSVSADRMKRFRERKRLCKEFVDDLPGLSREEAEKRLWEVMQALEGCFFFTEQGLRYRYMIKEDYLLECHSSVISKEKILNCFWKMMKEKERAVSDYSKDIYLYPIFTRIGLIIE